MAASASGGGEDKPEVLRKLLNFLKLPKAQRWICCEWFYSDIDRVIFESENDFALYLRQSFPRLKTTKLKRKQWCIVRSLIGKPRRCSDAFFQEERQMLSEKRHKIRLIQQRKLSEHDLLSAAAGAANSGGGDGTTGGEIKDLPSVIPLPLSIGNRVYAHITRPEEGVFLGTIAAVDPCEHTYRVVFDRASLGSRNVADYDVKSLSPLAQLVPVRAFLQAYRPPPLPPAAQTQPTPSTTTAATVAPLPTLTPTNLNLFLMNTPRFGGQTPLSTSNILIDDLNLLNATNPSIAAALALHSNIDPMLGIINSPLKLSAVTTTTATTNTTTDLSTPLKQNHQEEQQQQQASPMNAIYGNFPIQLLLMTTRLNKILLVKRDLVTKLTQMNSDAERIKANGQAYTSDFQIAYASLVLDLEKLNKDLSEYLNGVESSTNDADAAANGGTSSDTSGGDENNTRSSTSSSSHIVTHNIGGVAHRAGSSIVSAEACLRDSYELVDRLTKSDDGVAATVKMEQRHVDLIARLTGLLMQVRALVDGNAALVEQQRKKQQRRRRRQKQDETDDTEEEEDENDDDDDDDEEDEEDDDEEIENNHFIPYSTKGLLESINEIKHGLLSASNGKHFEDRVQVHLNHIESVLCHYNKLNAFKYDLSHK